MFLRQNWAQTPSNLAKAWEVIESRFRAEVDLPRANDSYFVQLAGIGLDAEVGKRHHAGFEENASV